MLKRILLGLLVLLLLLQLFRPEKNRSQEPQSRNISTAYPPTPQVQSILERACYDCHSNNTRYPWYAEVQPVAWWLQHHVNEGKEELNFDEFLGYPPRKQIRKMKESAELVEKGAMPLSSYTWIHKDAKLSREQAEAFAIWARGVERQVQAAALPTDSAGAAVDRK
ncbi:MAG: cytochrome C [Chitinophagaceae bacterium]|nr:MAG: cytochrome C [Chitinophagaceae bacterium]